MTTVSVYRRTFVVKVKPRRNICESYICLIESLNGPDVLPITVEEVGEHAVRMDAFRNNIHAKIDVLFIRKRLLQECPIEDVDAH